MWTNTVVFCKIVWISQIAWNPLRTPCDPPSIFRFFRFLKNLPQKCARTLCEPPANPPSIYCWSGYEMYLVRYFYVLTFTKRIRTLKSFWTPYPMNYLTLVISKRTDCIFFRQRKMFSYQILLNSLGWQLFDIRRKYTNIELIRHYSKVAFACK